MNSILTLFNTWWKKPFDPNGDAINWILFLGFAIVVAFLWTRILKKIPELSE